MFTFRIRNSDTSLTGWQYLRLLIPAAPSGYLRQLLRKGKILLGGTPLTPDSPLEAEAVLELPQSGRLKELMALAGPMLIDILYEDDLLLVADKPSGLAVHSSKGHENDNLLERVRLRSKVRMENFQVAPIHRLDLETSGPVIFGKGHQAISALGKSFMAGRIEKTYLALVQGDAPDSGALETPVPAKGKWKEAAAGFEIRERLGGFSLLEVDLESGRTHQIRRQLADANLPIVGDRRYRGPLPEGLTRLFLHCSQLVFPNPRDGYPLSVTSPLPGDLSRFLDSLRLISSRNI